MSDLCSICTKANNVCDHSPQPAFTLSSAPSGQSLSPSHTQRCGTHLWESGQWNASALHVLFSESKTHTIQQHREKFTLIYDVDKCLRSYSLIHQSRYWSHFEMSYFMLFLRISTHCICCPHLFHLHSRPPRHTPSCWKYSDDSRTQTVPPSRTYLSRIIK